MCFLIWVPRAAITILRDQGVLRFSSPRSRTTIFIYIPRARGGYVGNLLISSKALETERVFLTICVFTRVVIVPKVLLKGVHFFRVKNVQDVQDAIAILFFGGGEAVANIPGFRGRSQVCVDKVRKVYSFLVFGDGVQANAMCVGSLGSERVGPLITSEVELLAACFQVFEALLCFFAQVPRDGVSCLKGMARNPLNIRLALMFLVNCQVQQVPPFLSRWIFSAFFVGAICMNLLHNTKAIDIQRKLPLKVAECMHCRPKLSSVTILEGPRKRSAMVLPCVARLPDRQSPTRISHFLVSREVSRPVREDLASWGKVRSSLRKGLSEGY